MTASKPSMRPDLHSDDAPDLSSPEWRGKFAGARVRRGRPRAGKTKVSTTIRLDADIVETFRAQGSGWQSRINAALRQWLATMR